MPTVSFKQTKKTLAKKNNQDYYSGHRSKTHAAQLFKNQAVSKTPAQCLLCVSQDLREAQLTMAKCLNAESRRRAGDIQTISGNNIASRAGRCNRHQKERARSVQNHIEPLQQIVRMTGRAAFIRGDDRSFSC